MQVHFVRGFGRFINSFICCMCASPLEVSVRLQVCTDAPVRICDDELLRQSADVLGRVSNQFWTLRIK